MANNKHNFRHESLQDSKGMQEILKAISRGISKGKLTFSDDENDTIMTPEGLMHLKVTADEYDAQHHLNIRISWHSEDKKLRKKNLSVNK